MKTFHNKIIVASSMINKTFKILKSLFHVLYYYIQISVGRMLDFGPYTLQNLEGSNSLDPDVRLFISSRTSFKNTNPLHCLVI